MRASRVRLTVRQLMLLVAAVAVALVFVQEFRDGLPPRFVLRGIPGRMARLEPGMDRAQVSEILGLGTSWIRGGTSAEFYMAEGNGYSVHETYCVRPFRVVTLDQPGGDPPSLEILQSSGLIQLRFHRDSPESPRRRSGADRLEWASFSIDRRQITEIPWRPITP